MKIDIGGTPTKIIEENKFDLAIANGIDKQDIIAILDPFDLSRAEREFKYRGKNIKFQINTKEVNLDSEKIQPIIPDELPSELKEIVEKSQNLRDVMNEVVEFFYPNLKTIKLEEVLSKNKGKIYDILKKVCIPVRAICPKCNKFKKIFLGKSQMCCDTKDKEIIESGKYIPQQGFFAVITYLCGYQTLSNNEEKIKKAKEIIDILEIKGRPIKRYKKERKFNIIDKNEVKMDTSEVKGFQDFVGEEAEKREKIREILIRNFKLYGFNPEETPVVEYEEFVKGENEFDEAVSDIFKLKDKGERKLALRYEFTFQLKRLSKNKKLPYKRYQIGYVFRDEPVTGNRFRQITQADIDVVGSGIKEEAEILALTAKICKELGIKAEINVNNRKLLNSVIKSLGIDNVEFVLREIDKIDKQGEDAVKSNLAKFIDKITIIKLFKILNKPLSFFKKYVGYKEVQELIKLNRNYGIKIKFKPGLARGLSYYNGSIFEVKSKEMKETICAGGSYLVNNIPSTGISFGIERLSQLAKIKLDEKKVLIISIGQDKKAILLAEKLRKLGINCFILDKVSNGLEYANSYGIQQVIFLGKEEVKKKKVKLRDMKTGKEVMMGERELFEKLKS